MATNSDSNYYYCDDSPDVESPKKVENKNNNGGRTISAACLNVRSIRNKTAIVADIINESKLQILGLTETWHECCDDVALKRITLPGYRCIETARKPNERGRAYGGIAIIYSDSFSAKSLALESTPTTFEITATKISSVRTNFIFVVISTPVSDLFFTELEGIFESLATYNDQVVITGDFNVKVNIPSDPHAVRLLDLVRSFGFVQSVKDPTHILGNTLDLVITRSDLPHPSVVVDLPQMSDHSLVRFQIPIQRPPVQFVWHQYTRLERFDSERFRADLRGGGLCDPGIYEAMSIDEVQDLYDTTLSSLLDKHAPRRTAKRRYQPHTRWFDSECTASKRKSRMLERRYRRTRDSNDRFGSAKCDLLMISTSASRISTGRRGSRTVAEIPRNYGKHCREYLVTIKTTPFHPRAWRLTIFSKLLRRKLRMSVSPHHRPRILVSKPTAVPVDYWNSNRWTLTSSFNSSKLHRTKAVPWIRCRRG